MDIHKTRQTDTLRMIALLVVSAALLSACAKTKPSRFYVLRATQKEAASAERNMSSSIGVQLVSFPAFMDRPQIAERVGEHEIQLAEFERWAGPIDKNIAQALGDNLAALLPDARVVVFPWKQSQQPDVRVEVMLKRFDGRVGGDVVLEADCNIRTADGSIRQASKKFTRKAKEADYASLVATKSELLADLSREIAASFEAAQ